MWLFHSKQQTSHKFHKRRAKILIIQTTPQTVTIQKLNISLRNNKSKENRQMGIPENYKRTKKISTKFTNYSTRQKKFRPLKHPTKTILRQHRHKKEAKSKEQNYQMCISEIPYYRSTRFPNLDKGEKNQ